MIYSTITQIKEREITDLGDIVKETMELLKQTAEEKKGLIIFDGLPKKNVIKSQFRQNVSEFDY